MDNPSGAGLRVVGGRYRLIERLGQGGMGTVWRAHDEVLARTVAVKEVDLPQVGEIDKAQLRERTLREARAAARLTHPNAVTVYDVVEEGGQPWIVMQLVAADSLADVIRDNGPLEAVRVAEIGLDVLSALEAAHAAGILHRDVKPGNVLLGHDGRVVLTDFGIATLEGDPSLTSTGLLLGAPAYIAPERARGQTPGPASDLWSLGATLFTAMEGRPPYDRGTPMATLTAMISEEPPVPSTGGPLSEAVSGLLRRDPAERIGTPYARELLEQARAGAPAPLATTLATPLPAPAQNLAAADRTQIVHRPEPPAYAPGLPGVAVPSRPPDTATTPGKQPRRLTAILVTLVLLLAATVIGVIVLANREPTAPARGAAPSAGASKQPTRAPASTPPASTQPAVTSGPIGPGTAPAGYFLYTDPSGFAIAVPNGWRKARQRAGQFDFVDPANSQRFLRIGSTTTPKDDPVADWEQQERSLKAREPSYQKISIESVEYRDYAAADWDFRIGSTRVKNRGFKVNDEEGHAIYLSAPESQFDSSMKIFDVATATFRPAT